MEIQYLRYFKKIAELEHMTRASEALQVAQPTLSKTISFLEKAFQVKVFDRIGKNIILNENGRILLKYTNQILNSLEDAKTQISDRNKKQDITVTISMHAASKLLPSIIYDFKKKYPDIKFAIVLHEDKSNEKMNCDLIIDSTRDKVIAKNVIQLLEEEILLAVPKEHPLSHKKSITLEEVASEAFISLQKGKGLSDITTAFCLSAGFEPNIILESDDPATIRGLIGIGLGVAFLPAITWQGVADANMKLLSISNINCKRYINVSWKEGRYFSESAKLFRDYLVDFFSKLLQNNYIS
ncbi:MAG TPA: LysR family transcriptional regulator [Ruminiclostridium sp.]